MHHICSFLLLAALANSALATSEPISFEGTIQQVTTLPDPSVSPYTDCLFTVQVLPQGASDDAPTLLLALEGFVDRTLTPHADLQPGQLIRVQEARLYEQMPDAYQSRQLVDDVLDVDLDVYAGIRVTPISAFTPGGFGQAPQLVEAESAIQPAEPQPLARQQRADIIRSERERIERLKRPHGTWAEWFAALAPVRDRLQQRLDEEPNGYLRGDRASFCGIGTTLDYELDDQTRHYQNVMTCFRMLDQEFKSVGTDLIVVPIPMKDMVYAERFVDPPLSDRVVNPSWYKFMHDCLKQDIEVVDLLPRFQAELANPDVNLYHYNTRDGHPSGQGVRIAADEIAKRLERYTFGAAPVDVVYAPKKYMYKKPKYLLFDPDTIYSAWKVVDAQGSYFPTQPDSEVLVIGDSMLTAPAIISGASLGQHVAGNVRIPLTYFKRPGSASEIGILLSHLQDNQFFSRRTVCLFLFDGGQLFRTDKNWRTRAFISNRWSDSERSP